MSLCLIASGVSSLCGETLAMSWRISVMVRVISDTDGFVEYHFEQFPTGRGEFLHSRFGVTMFTVVVGPCHG